MMSEQKVEPLTRVYVVPLGLAFEAQPKKRAKKAITLIKQFTTRHMKATDVRISVEVNELIWSNGIKRPPRRIRLEMERDEDGLVSVKLAKEPE